MSNKLEEATNLANLKENISGVSVGSRFPLSGIVCD